MREIMIREATSCTLKELVLKFIPEAIGKMIEKECNGIFPLTHVYIRKVKLLQSPKFDPQALRELHDKAGMPEDLGVPVEAEAEADKGKAAGGEKKKEGGGKGGKKDGAGGKKDGAKGGEKKKEGGGKKEGAGEKKEGGGKKEGAGEKKEGGGKKEGGEKKEGGGKGGKKGQ